MFSRLLSNHSVNFTRTWAIVFVMVVTEWVSNTHQLPRKNGHSYYKKQQYGFELSHNLRKYDFKVGRKNWLFGFAEGWALSVGAKPMCQLRVGRKTKNAGGAKIKSLRVGFPNSRDR